MLSDLCLFLSMFVELLYYTVVNILKEKDVTHLIRRTDKAKV